MRAKHFIFFAVGMTWFVAVVWLVLGNVIVRETWLGVIAQQIDRLPPALASLVFSVAWLIFFLGWAVPLILGLTALARKGHL